MKLYEGCIETARKGRIKIVSADSPDEALKKLEQLCNGPESVMKIRCDDQILYDFSAGGWKNRGF